MEDRTHAILIHGPQSDIFARLKQELEYQGIFTTTATTPEEALGEFKGGKQLLLVFTDTITPAGTWADVLRIFDQEHIPVIVVSRTVDLDLYINVLERGAFDFIVPPFVGSDLAYIVHNATSHACGCLN